MKIIPAHDWESVHELACGIANAAGADDQVLVDSKTEALLFRLGELERIYGPCSRITATIADYSDDRKIDLYLLALQQAKDEMDSENEAMIRESIEEIQNEK